MNNSCRRVFRTALLAILFSCFFSALGLHAQTASRTAVDATSTYHQLQSFTLSEKVFALDNLVFQHDRVTITFQHGKLFLAVPVEGKVCGAVFMGIGKVHAEPPPLVEEQDNVRRLLNSDNVEVEFKTAVFRFTGDFANPLAQNAKTSDEKPGKAQDLAVALDGRFLEENGVNLSSRILGSILNSEPVPFFFARFEGGKQRFDYLFDPLAQLPAMYFGIDSGEKGLLLSYDPTIFRSDIWTAFYAEDEYARGKAIYADSLNLVSTPKYTFDAWLLEPKKVLDLKVRIDTVSRVDGLRSIPFVVGEDLGTYDKEIKKKQLRVQGVHTEDGKPLVWFQEPWEGGFTVVLPQPVARGTKFALNIELHGDFMMESQTVTSNYFPRSAESWYPRHGVLQRSEFDFTALHRKRDKVVSTGNFVKEEPAGDGKNDLSTTFSLQTPMPLTTFAVGPYEIHRDVAKQPGHPDIALEFYSLPGSVAAIKEDFILAEMGNAVRYFGQLFGDYPFPVFRAAFHPFAYGQGFPTTLMIPGTDRSDKFTFEFIAHETSHQWWGDMVLWRSYRDQWLSEGFAEYSGMMYTQLRDKAKSEKDLIKLDKDRLLVPPRNLQGIGKGRVVDVGPLIFGRRLNSREAMNAYYPLTYFKGALVLRMLHFLFTDPATGDGQPFFDMMADFVHRYKGKSASTDDFFAVANEHLPQTPLAKKYGYKDLGWFYRQWVLQSYLPSYRLAYHIEDAPGGGVLLVGEVAQESVPDKEKWFMPLPVSIDFGGGKTARGTVAVLGSRTPFKIKLAERPQKVELDPGLWILSEHTNTSRQ